MRKNGLFDVVKDGDLKAEEWVIAPEDVILFTDIEKDLITLC